MTTTPTMLATRIATLVQTRLCNLQAEADLTARGHLDMANAQSGWVESRTQAILGLVEDHLPSGSGFDRGTSLDFDKSTGEKLVFDVSFHHMDEHGFYSGWSDHTVVVTASLTGGFNLKITGRDRNGIKDYIHECFGVALGQVG